MANAVSKTLRITAAIVLFLHGLIHLIGTAVYLQWAHIEGLPYKTTLLGGGWNEERAASGCVVYSGPWQPSGSSLPPSLCWPGGVGGSPYEWGVVLLSLTLTILDWGNAFAGAILDSLIRAVLWLGPRLASWFAA